jgi:hypothetical protein
MTVSRKVLCWVYAAIAVAALVGTWGNNLKYLSLGFMGANQRFWLDTLANPASRSITVDIFFLSLAAVVWLMLEARRLQMPGAWWYVLGSLLVAVSVAFPLFMIHRELTLAAHEAESSGGTLHAGDVVGLVALALAFVGYTAYALHAAG